MFFQRGGDSYVETCKKCSDHHPSSGCSSGRRQPLTLFDVFGYRTWTTEKLTSDFHTMARRKFGDEGEAIVLIDHNEDAIALLCCNATRDKGYFELHKRDLISGKWEKSMGSGTLERKLVCTVMQRPTSVRTIPKEPAYFSLNGKDNEPSLRLYNSNDWEEGK